MRPSPNKSRSLFRVEDTTDLCYRDVTSALERRQWVSTNPIAEKDKKGVLRSNNSPKFVWTISEKSINFDKLRRSQLVNHFQGISALTTKNGLCDILREMQWINVDHREVSPRCVICSPILLLSSCAVSGRTTWETQCREMTSLKIFDFVPLAIFSK